MDVVEITHAQWDRKLRALVNKNIRERGTSWTEATISSAANQKHKIIREVRDRTMIVRSDWRACLTEVALMEVPYAQADSGAVGEAKSVKEE